jgi:four helix bundle protein
MGVYNFRDTKVYQKGFALAMEIFELTKQFPSEERYSLTDQIRRSSRSVCSCLDEAYRKKQYSAHFIAKVSDADMENSETMVWLDFSFACKYISVENYHALKSQNEEIGKLLSHMLRNPEKY